jgi:tetratricopeptide (TPR) repeat protein
MTPRDQARREAQRIKRHLVAAAVALVGVAVAVAVIVCLPGSESPGPPEQDSTSPRAGGSPAKDLEDRLVLAQALMALDGAAEAQEAELEIDEVLKRAPRTAKALWLKGELVARRGGDKYMYFYQQAAQSPDATPEIWVRYGLTLKSSGDPAAAEEYLRKAYDAGVKDHRTCGALGELAYGAKRFRQAADYLAEAVKRRPSDARSWRLLAAAQRNLGEIDAALKTLEEAIKVARGDDRADLLLERGQTQLRQAGPDGLKAAAQTFAEATAYSKVAADAALRAAQCYSRIPGCSGPAMQYVDLAARLRPNDKEVLNLRAEIEDARFGRRVPPTAPASEPSP